ncbi:hypothetical protein [Chamaesiphon sp.]|uniref:hypothetical protein n=1 Tax=Chamaesiphon sp. TaxID=2814140 RepID=UPI0035946082
MNKLAGDLDSINSRFSKGEAAPTPFTIHQAPNNLPIGIPDRLADYANLAR